MSHIADRRKLGYLPFQHFERGVNLRNVLYGVRYLKRGPAQQDEIEEGTQGDVLGALLWRAKKSGAQATGGGSGKPARDLPAWGFGYPAKAVADSTPQGSVFRIKVLPIGDKAITADDRFDVIEAYCSVPVVNGQTGVLMAATEESEQIEIFLPAKDSLIAVHWGKPGSGGSRVYDLKPDGKIDPTRFATLQHAFRTFRIPKTCGGDLYGPPGPGINGLAFQLHFAKDGSRSGVIADGPGPKQRLAALAKEMGGPLFSGFPGDKHDHGANEDGESVGSAHIPSGALFAKDPLRDAPLRFSDEFISDIADLPGIDVETRLVYDYRSTHGSPCGPKSGLWRWVTQVPFGIPDRPGRERRRRRDPRRPGDPDPRDPRFPNDPNQPRIPGGGGGTGIGDGPTGGGTDNNGEAIDWLEPEAPRAPGDDPIPVGSDGRPRIPTGFGGPRPGLGAPPDGVVIGLNGAALPEDDPCRRQPMATLSEWSFPSIIFQAEHKGRGNEKLYGAWGNKTFQDEMKTRPTIGRFEAVGNQTAAKGFNYTKRPPCPYTGGTADGLVVFTPPEFGVKEHFAGRVPTTYSRTFLTACRTGFAWGCPDEEGHVGDGFTSEYDADTGTLTIDKVTGGLTDETATLELDSVTGELRWNGTDISTGGGGGGGGGTFTPAFPYGGDGIDGLGTADGATAIPGFTLAANIYTQTRSVSLTDLNVSAGITIRTAGHYLGGTGTLTNAGKIERNGGNATAGGGGAAPGGTQGIGAAGAAGVTASGNGTGGSAFTAALGGSGGNGGATGGSSGGTGGIATRPASTTQPIYNSVQATQNNGRMMTLTAAIDPSGGGSGASGGFEIGAVGRSGSGGAAAGNIQIAFATIVCTGAGTIEAKGGDAYVAAGTGDMGGGGGGGGGCVRMIANSFSGCTSGTTILVTGGALSNGIGAGTAGTAGTAGQVIMFTMGGTNAPGATNDVTGLIMARGLMAVTAKSLASGEVPTTATVIYTVGAATRCYARSLRFYNTGTAPVIVLVYVTRSGQTIRTVDRGRLSAYGVGVSLEDVAALLSTGDAISVSADAAGVDYTLTGAEET